MAVCSLFSDQSLAASACAMNRDSESLEGAIQCGGVDSAGSPCKAGGFAACPDTRATLHFKKFSHGEACDCAVQILEAVVKTRWLPSNRCGPVAPTLAAGGGVGMRSTVA